MSLQGLIAYMDRGKEHRQKSENTAIYPILEPKILSPFMRLCSYQLSFLFIIVFCLSVPKKSIAQSSIWDNPKNAKDKAGKTAGKATSSVKKWKDHLQRWGLDSNYNHSLSVAGKLNTNGWSVGLLYQKPAGTPWERRRGKHAGQSTYFSLFFSEIKHEKQVKQQKDNTSFPELGASLPYVYGKINNLYLLQLGVGKEQLLLPGVLDGNLSVSFRYGGGFSLAMLKPYYLNLMYITFTPQQVVTLKEERYSEDNAELFLDKNKIFGGSKWTKGLDEIRYVPGLFIEGAFVLEAAKHKSFVQLVTFGGQFSAYTKSLPVMADRKAYPYSGCLYVGLSLGQRWK